MEEARASPASAFGKNKVRWGTIQTKVADDGANTSVLEKAKNITSAIRRASSGEESFVRESDNDTPPGWSSVQKAGQRQRVNDSIGTGSADDTSSPYAALVFSTKEAEPSFSGKTEKSRLRRQKSMLRRDAVMANILQRRLQETQRSTIGPKKDPWYLLNPRQSRWVERLDIATTAAITFTALVTPFESAFLGPPADVSLLFVINRIVDLVFTVDMVAQFFTIITIDNGVNGFQYVTDQRRIAREYIKGWFVLDFCTNALSVVDFYSVANRGQTSDNVAQLKVRRGT